MITKECSMKQSIVNASFQMTAFSIVNLFATCYQCTYFQITDMKAIVY